MTHSTPAQGSPGVTEGDLRAHPRSAWGSHPVCAPPLWPPGARAQPLLECVVLHRSVFGGELAAQVLCSLRLGVLVCSTGESAQQARGFRGK